MEWGGSPVDSIEEAKSQVKDIEWTNVDVVQVLSLGSQNEDGLPREGRVVATGLLGQGWRDV